MATNLAIDPQLIQHALDVSGARTKKEAVTAALQEFIARREQAKIVESFGTLEWDSTYDFKAERSRRVSSASNSAPCRSSNPPETTTPPPQR